MSDQPAPPNWYPDPFGRHEHRWFDGVRWIDHVSSHRRQSVDRLTAAHVPRVVVRDVAKTQEDLAAAGVAGAPIGEIHRPLADPLRHMLVAPALSVDTALKQDSRRFG